MSQSTKNPGEELTGDYIVSLVKYRFVEAAKTCILTSTERSENSLSIARIIDEKLVFFCERCLSRCDTAPFGEPICDTARHIVYVHQRDREAYKTVRMKNMTRHGDAQTHTVLLRYLLFPYVKNTRDLFLFDFVVCIHGCNGALQMDKVSDMTIHSSSR